MIITLKPETEARLRKRAGRDGQDAGELLEVLVLNALADDPEDADELDARYREMAADKEREAEAMEWIEGTLGNGRK